MQEEENNRKKIIIDRKKEARSKDISRMIDEGGLGSRTYYDIKKVGQVEDKNENNKDEE